jgi:hypothetical protein
MLALEINEIRLRGSPVRANDGPLLSVAEVRKTMRIGNPKIYEIHNRKTSLAQFPVLFYPNMLKIYDNGHPISYGSLGRSAALKLPPGDHIITADFTGVTWANILSLLTWVGVILVLILIKIRYYFTLTEAAGFR